MAETRARKAKAAAMTPLERVVSQIRKGEFDDGIAEIVNAVTGRVMEGAVALCWRIDLDDLHVTEDDMTLDEAFQLEKILGVTWGALDPIKSAEHATALIRVMLPRLGLEPGEVEERTKAYPVKQVLAAITRYSEVDPPKG